MTFTEAALEVLEREGRAMHAREIADRAVAWGLLSHVGKTPVQTMSARISTVVAKGPDKSPFVRVRPGVFALAKWKGEPPGPKAPPPPPKESKPAPAPTAAQEPTEQAEPTQKKRKRRRRKKRSDSGEAAGASPQPEKKAQKPTPKQAAKKAATPKQEAKSKTEQKPKQKPKQKQKPADSGRPTKTVVGSAPVDVAEATVEILRKHTAPLAPEALAKAIGWKGERAILMLDALLTAEGLDRELRGLRPRFVRHRSGWALAEREVSSEIVELERQVSDAADRLSQLAERQIQRRLRSLPLKALVRVVVMYLRRQGFDSMTPVDRGNGDEFHLSVLDRRGGGQFRTAVVVRRDPANKPVTDRAVSDLRGALHHYGSMSALIVTTGTFADQAREEGEVSNLAPVALVDGETLARELARVSIGVRVRRVGLPAFDEAFFSALGA